MPTVTSIPSDRDAATPWGLLFAISGLACVVRGYGFSVEDQHLTLPALKRVLDPSLYPGDLLFTKSLSDFSLYEDLLALPARVAGIEWTFFVAYIVVTFAITVAVFKIGRELFHGRAEALLAAAMLCGAHTQAGAMRLQLFDYYLYPRTVSLAFGLFGLWLTMRQQWSRAAFCVGLEFVVHPPSSLATLTVLAACLLMALAGGRAKWRDGALAAGAFLLPASVLLAKMLFLRGGRGLEFFGAVDDRWFRIIHDRTPYMFYRNWPLSRLGQVALYAVLFLVACRHTAAPGRRVMLTVLAAVVGLNVFNLLARDVARVPVFMQLHLEASLKLIALLGLVHVGALVWRCVRCAGTGARLAGLALAAQMMLMRGGESWLSPDQWELAATLAWVSAAALLAGMVVDRWRERLGWAVVLVQAGALLLWLSIAWDAALALAAAAGVVVLWAKGRSWPPATAVTRAVLVALAAFGLVEVTWSVARAGSVRDGIARHVAIPGLGRATAFDRMAQWMRGHTPRDAMFMGPSALSGLRYLSERPYFVTYKDGGQVLYDRDYAIEWELRMALLAALGRSDEARLKKAAERLRLDYAIASKGRPLALPAVYRDEDFVIYRLRERLPH